MKNKFVMVIEESDLLKMIGTPNGGIPVIDYVNTTISSTTGEKAVEVTFTLSEPTQLTTSSTNQA